MSETILPGNEVVGTDLSCPPTLQDPTMPLPLATDLALEEEFEEELIIEDFTIDGICGVY